MHHFEALIFDFGNVLIDLDIPQWENNIKSIINPSLDPDETRRALEDLFLLKELGKISDKEFLNQFSQYAISGISQEHILEIWNSILIKIEKNIFSLLLELRKYFKVYLLSNTNSLHIDWVYTYLKDEYQIEDWDERYFDQTFYSHKMGMRKPNADIYEKVIQLIGLKPKSMLFFDDNVDNIRTAQKLGIQGYLKPPRRPLPQIIHQLGLLKEKV